MKFDHRNVGIFKVVTPQLDKRERFHAETFKLEVLSLLKAGQINVVVDFSNIDYIGSDAIGALVVLNTGTKKLSGRFLLMNLNDTIHEVLETSGMTQLLKIVNDENELSAESEKITQSTG